MSVALLVLGLVLLALPAALAGAGARLAPEEWCRAVVLCLRIGLLSIHVALGLAALPVVFAAVGAHGIAHACHPLVTGADPLPPAVGVAAGLAVLASAVRGVAARRRDAEARRRLRAEPWLGRHRMEDGVEVVTLPTPDRVAYAVHGSAGRPGQVVVSEGLLAGLDPEEVRAVIGHERAHLRHRHDAVLTLARDVEARTRWFPPARASAAVLRLAVERAADEEAGAATAAARPALRTALLKVVALAATPVPAFTDVGTVAARLRALAATPPAPSLRDRLAATGPIVALVAVAIVGLVGCVLLARHGLHGLFGHGYGHGSHAGHVVHELGHAHPG